MQGSQEIQGIFNAIAPVYDQINDRMSFGLHRVWKKMAIRWTDCKPGDTVLDLCCGTGDLAFLLARRVGVAGTVWGVDFAAAQLAQARRRDREGRVRWLEADALDLPFADDSFDAVTQGFGLRNVVDIPACFAQLRRVLKPGGRAVILDLHAPADAGWRAFQRWYLEGWVTALGRAQGLEAEYAYIAPSLERFPTGDEQVRLAQQAGFSQASHYPLIGGTVGVLVAQ